MLGSTKQCTYCGSDKFSRVQLNRTVRCDECKCIVEEYCNHDLAEYYVTTHSEELHCVVSPDFLRKHIVDDIPNDPYCTPGFITAFRMLSPQYEPVFGAPARTMSGALAEMERLIGDALYSGYVGYNGRAPGVAVRKEESVKEGQERRREGGDARHILVAYFEIKELASILGVDWQTSNMAIRIFRYTASNTSLRNRSVESLATAAFVAAVQRRCREHEEAVANANSSGPSPTTGATIDDPEWLTKLKSLTVRDIAQAANIDENEVQRNLKVVHVAMRKQRPDSYESIVAQMPLVCNQLQLDDRTRRLAVDIAERAIRLNICSRRLPASVSAACIYMACQLDGVRKTQQHVCRAIGVTEVTIRKVHKELIKQEKAVVPTWFTELKRGAPNGSSVVPAFTAAGTVPRMQPQGVVTQSHIPSDGQPSDSRVQGLPPPPLPPGFSQSSTQQSTGSIAAQQSSGHPSIPPTTSASTLPIQPPDARGSGASSASAPSSAPTASVDVPSANGAPNPAAVQALATALAAMNPAALEAFSNPAAVQAFLNTMAMMPHMPSMMAPPPPPPPPPLPPRLPERSTQEPTHSSTVQPPSVAVADPASVTSQANGTDVTSHPPKVANTYTPNGIASQSRQNELGEQ